MPSPTSSAWAAGFFDGEGTTGAYKSSANDKCYIRLMVGQAHREVLDKLTEFLGCGKVYGKGPFKWMVGNFESVQWCMIQMWPYLNTEKREQYKRALRKDSRCLHQT